MGYVLVFRMSTGMNDSIHVQIQIIKLHIIWIRFTGINRNLYTIAFFRLWGSEELIVVWLFKSKSIHLRLIWTCFTSELHYKISSFTPRTNWSRYFITGNDSFQYNQFILIMWGIFIKFSTHSVVQVRNQGNYLGSLPSPSIIAKSCQFNLKNDISCHSYYYYQHHLKD